MHIAGTRLLQLTTDTTDDGRFPPVLSPESGVSQWPQTLAWLNEHRDSLLRALSDHGAIVLRDFDIDSVEHFDQLVTAFGLPAFTYAESLSNAVRVNVTERVFTANEAPPALEIFLHHEMAQTPIYPTRLFFYCETAALTGGQTPLCRSDRVYEALTSARPQFIERCESLGVRYTNTMPDHDDAASGQGRSWRSTLGVATRDAAEARLKQLGYDYEWMDSGALRVTTPVLPAVRTLRDGRKVFFNQLIAAYRGWNDQRNTANKSVSFGDGSAMDVDGLTAACDIADALTFDLPWQAGDVALVDNFLVMHGRRPYTGQRRVLAALAGDQGM